MSYQSITQRIKMNWSSLDFLEGKTIPIREEPFIPDTTQIHGTFTYMTGLFFYGKCIGIPLYLSGPGYVFFQQSDDSKKKKHQQILSVSFSVH